MGTAIKAWPLLSRRERAPVLFKKSLAVAMSEIITGLPVLTTFPVIPSPGA